MTTPAYLGDTQRIGKVVGGSLKGNICVRLEVPQQKIQEGSLIVMEDGGYQYFGTAADMQLMRYNPDANEPDLADRDFFTNLLVIPALQERQGSLEEQDRTGKKEFPTPIKSIPGQRSIARLANAGDVAEIFGEPGSNGNFVIGYTHEQHHPVCVNLARLVQRSAGIFGATGSGKSFLARIILAGLIDYDKASVLVYDMHNEYGFDDTASDTGENVRGLRSGFGPSRVYIAGLGAGAAIRGNVPDFDLTIGYKDIATDDVALLTEELNLRETTATVLDALAKSFGEKWFGSFKKMIRGAVERDMDGKSYPAPDSVAYWAVNQGVNVAAAEALHDKLRRLFNRPYIIENPPADSLQEVIDLLKRGKHVVLSFGKYESDLDYLLVSNLITRRIRAEWEEMTNEYRSQKGQEPRQLVVVLEEAHKMLNRAIASQTTFSAIAREMRKYYVTLLIIDQRPSQIYDEVMSQIGTRICGWLGDDDDITAVLSGLSGRDMLRGMLSRLQAKEEVLLLGWGVPMPVLLCSCRYNAEFWTGIKRSMDHLDANKAIKDIWGT